MEIDIISQRVPFIMVPKQAFEDRNLSVTEKGLYGLLYSVLPIRTFTIEELSIVAGISYIATYTSLQRLADAGYLRFSKNGKIYFNAIC